MILNRPLFADALALAEIATVDEAGRKQLALGRQLAGLADMEGVLKEGESRGKDSQEGIDAIAKRRRQAEEFARQENLNLRPWRPDNHLKDLANKHDRGDEYLDLRITHLFVHGSTTATSQRYSQTGERAIEVGGHAADLKTWANPTGLFAAHSALHAARAACAIFGWTQPPELEVLMAEVREELEHMNASSTD
jgi:hypothetical protein